MSTIPLGIDKILVAIADFQKLGIDSIALALAIGPNPKNPGSYLTLPKVVADLYIEVNDIKNSIDQIKDVSPTEVEPLLQALMSAIVAIVVSVL